MLSALLVAAALPVTAASDRTVYVLDGGTVRTVQEQVTPELPRPPLVATAARRGAARGPSVPAALGRLRRERKLSTTELRRRRATWARALATEGRLRGRRHRELGAVIANVRTLARQGGLRASRLPAVFLQLERNREWWLHGRFLPYGARVEFRGSEILWEAFPGQGLAFHPLGNFGKANGLRQGHYDRRLRHILRELRPLAAWRAGGRAWEYYFSFDGSPVLWVSGIAQGTAVQAWAKAGSRLHDRSMLRLARSGLAVFRRAPPLGLRVRRSRGAHYLIYSFAPRTYVLNAFVQALNALFDVWHIAHSTTAKRLFVSGEREMIHELPRYDTGSWSLYDGHVRSPYSYHVLLRDFLRGQCARRHKRPVCVMARRFTRYLHHQRA